MEYGSSENLAMVYETLTNIARAITTLQERTASVSSADDFISSPQGMEKLDAACMVIMAIGESIKNLDKLTNKELLPTYPEIDWRGLMGVRDIIAHRYFQIDAEAVFNILKEDIPSLGKAISFFLNDLFPN